MPFKSALSFHSSAVLNAVLEPGETAVTTHTREDVSFDSEGTRCPAWPYGPDGVVDPPVIVMAHGFASIRELRLDAYGERFAQAGFAALVFDYRGFGASDGQPPRVIGTRA